MSKEPTQEDILKGLKIMNYNSLEFMSNYPGMTPGVVLIERVYPKLEKIVKEWFRLENAQRLASKLDALEKIEKDIANLGRKRGNT